MLPSKQILTHFGILLFPFVLPLPLPLNIKSIALILFAATLIFNVSKDGFLINKLVTDKIVVLFFWLFFLDPILSYVRGDGFYISDLRISFMVLPILCLLNKDWVEFYRSKILKTYTIGVFFYIFFTIGYVVYFYFISSKEFAVDYFLKYVTYHFLPYAIHHTYLGIYISFAASIIIFDKELKNGVKVFLCLILFLSIFIIASKLSILLFILVISFCLSVNFKYSFSKIVLFIIFIVLISTLIIGFFYLQTDLFRTLDISINNRERLFGCSFEGISDNLLIGIGSANIKGFIEQCDPTLVGMDTHNIFLQEFLANGIFGFTVLISLLFTFLRGFIEKKVILGIVLILMLSTFGLTENLLNLQHGVTFFIFFLLLFHYQK
ncbi:O-antigen ligase family protein [Spongiimicrobium sp. 3-5]|uniref:O-antigen ligase family protein n=1 Tax=Spongiimicrobium sp. 3-5 TaxID=3332596 RepID=UPI00397FA7D3